ncbi:hypothetical protein MRX96_033604 [Rhipicephalus microplus]
MSARPLLCAALKLCGGAEGGFRETPRGTRIDSFGAAGVQIKRDALCNRGTFGGKLAMNEAAAAIDKASLGTKEPGR